ncbi:MAG: hypothetical protein NXI21_01930 [Alphaproteobacteria bacterium]|nr:hypothetical protein [Alphaproteobacteria bacterium]
MSVFFTRRPGATDRIKARVAEHYGVSVADLEAARRDGEIILPRWVAIHLCRRLTGHSLPKIGAAFGGRDHSTIVYALGRIEEMVDEDPDLAAVIEKMHEELCAEIGTADIANELDMVAGAILHRLEGRMIADLRRLFADLRSQARSDPERLLHRLREIRDLGAGEEEGTVLPLFAGKCGGDRKRAGGHR